MNNDDKYPGSHPEACFAIGLDTSKEPINLDDLEGLVALNAHNLASLVGHARARRLAQDIIGVVDGHLSLVHGKPVTDPTGRHR